MTLEKPYMKTDRKEEGTDLAEIAEIECGPGELSEIKKMIIDEEELAVTKTMHDSLPKDGKYVDSNSSSSSVSYRTENE
jgi:hypothetical protein